MIIGIIILLSVISLLTFSLVMILGISYVCLSDGSHPGGSTVGGGVARLSGKGLPREGKGKEGYSSLDLELD